jgi:drug/metabolite transporter (DMT)-like permease
VVAGNWYFARMPLKFLIPFGFALIAALGNVLFVYGNRKVGHTTNPFFFTATVMAICLSLYLIGTLLFGMRGSGEFLRKNILWCSISGVGMFLTFLGFYLLYSRFDTSYYALFVVTSMLLTTLVLGVLVLHERINLYGGISIAAAVVSIVFFGLSKR